MTQGATSPTLLKEGILWHDLQHKPIARAVTDAARRYQARFGIEPTACHVSPQHFLEGERVGAVKLVPDSRVRPWHYWVGRIETAEELKDGRL